ncbi:thioredoxin domain-containing protein [Pasteuria penetrans]|uniref:DsbA family protein n=1 Tax=Pasteuria penetrans TaxID=86005 RepID=UPI0011EFD9EA|nr:thioredoxin domain-containing protein [Pasteuria penetrans]
MNFDLEENKIKRRQRFKTLAMATLLGSILGVGVFVLFKERKDPGAISAAAFRDLPYQGKKEAPLEAFEVFDFECVHCRDFILNVYPKIKQEYIDKGKLKFHLINVNFIDKSGFFSAVPNIAGQLLLERDPEGYDKFCELVFQNHKDIFPREEKETLRKMMEEMKTISGNKKEEELTKEEQSKLSELKSKIEKTAFDGIKSRLALVQKLVEGSTQTDKAKEINGIVNGIVSPSDDPQQQSLIEKARKVVETRTNQVGSQKIDQVPKLLIRKEGDDTLKDIKKFQDWPSVKKEIDDLL